MIRGVLWDMDGLMFDTERIGLQGWQAAASSCSDSVSRAAAVSNRSVSDGTVPVLMACAMSFTKEAVAGSAASAPKSCVKPVEGATPPPKSCVKPEWVGACCTPPPRSCVKPLCAGASGVKRILPVRVSTNSSTASGSRRANRLSSEGSPTTCVSALGSSPGLEADADSCAETDGCSAGAGCEGVLRGRTAL